MKRFYIIVLFIVSLGFCQDRSVIFNTGSPDSTSGHLIDNDHSIANRFYTQNKYVLEAMVFYMSLQSATGSVNVSIREDNNGSPGELVSELATWQLDLNPFNTSFYNLILTTDLCIYLDSGYFYRWTIDVATPMTEATWIYSNNDTFYYASSSNSGESWSMESGYAGAGGIWAEQIYESPTLDGDVNLDFVLNVIDIVNLVGHIMETSILGSEALTYADVNHDGLINVVDVVQLVNIILADSLPNSDFTLEDINPASEYFGNFIGPSFFNGQVSCYYFGKQG